MRNDLDKIVRDIYAVARAIDTRWRQNRCTWGNKSDAGRIRRVVDLDALWRAIRFVADQDAPAGTVRGYEAARRLEDVFRIIELHQTEIAKRLATA